MVTLNEASELFAALLDPDIAVRTAAARKLLRLQLDAEAKAKLRSFDWATLGLDQEILAELKLDGVYKAFRSYPNALPLPEPAADSPAAPKPERAISFWIREREADIEEPLKIKETYTARCRVGAAVASSLIKGTYVQESDVPPAGLLTRWKVVPQNVKFTVVDETVTVSAYGVAEFDLLIPAEGDSRTVDLGITPLSAGAELTIMIQVGEKIYRELRVSLDFSAKVISDMPCIALGHANLRTTHEWTTPPGVISLTVLMAGKALVGGGVRGTPYPAGELLDMETAQAMLSGPLDKLRSAAENFRAKSTSYLSDIDPVELEQKLNNFQPQYDWVALDDFADKRHAEDWAALATTAELRSVAFYGKQLYDTIFRKETKLRGWLDALPPGQQIHVIWRADSGAAWVPYIPWELLYQTDVKPGAPVDAARFWGLSYRLQYTAYRPPSYLSAALGGPLEACCANVMYFGDSPKDSATAEALWQRQVWTSLVAAGKSCLSPAGGSVRPKPEIQKALAEPESLLPSGKGQIAVLYLFCHYDASNNVPVLRFGLDSSNPDDVLQETELSTATLASYPLVFANACSTAGTGLMSANDLTRSFFGRGCRAFIGTDCKVPPALASRFAVIFFHFLLRLADYQKRPMSAGEAMSQARLFLWCYYKNIGGLLYSYLNQYDLYLASEAEVFDLRS